MLRPTLQLALSVPMLCLLTEACLAQPDIVCRQYLMVANGNVALYVACYHEHGECADCYWVWHLDLANQACPEVCPDCDTIFRVAGAPNDPQPTKEKADEAADQKLPIDEDFQLAMPFKKGNKPYKHVMPEKAVAKVPDDAEDNAWYPRQGATVLSVRKAYIQSEDTTVTKIPVYLYIMKIDAKRAVLPPGATPHKHKVQVHLFGVEVDEENFPANAPVLKPIKLSEEKYINSNGQEEQVYVHRRRACRVKFDGGESESYFVITTQNIFNE